MKLMKDIPRNELSDFEDDYTDTHEFVRECCMVSHANTKAIKEMTNRWHNHIKETFKLCPKASEEELKKYQNDLITEGNRILMLAMQSLKFGKTINKSMCDLGLHAKKVFYWTKNELDQEEEGRIDDTAAAAASPEVSSHVILSKMVKKFVIFMDIYKRMPLDKQVEHLVRLIEEHAESQVALRKVTAGGRKLSTEEIVAICDLLLTDSKMRKVIREILHGSKEQLADFKLTPRILKALAQLVENENNE
ncbi:hypothetical protein TTRE_0000125701 [Trichuris trichiura]|uniref:Uncharacterized protein n=1 Tax=Trichuris trichiura TaxID=36087 RepID=A0A077YYZ6_TRITR|nr:hypothetical protein TTRE_0000125701 [Trichuris trichiura]